MLFCNNATLLSRRSAMVLSQDRMVMQLWFHAVMGLSSTDRSVDEEQGNQSRHGPARRQIGACRIVLGFKVIESCEIE